MAPAAERSPSRQRRNPRLDVVRPADQARALPSGTPAARRGPGDSRPGSRRRPPRRLGPVTRARPRRPATSDRSGPRRRRRDAAARPAGPGPPPAAGDTSGDSSGSTVSGRPVVSPDRRVVGGGPRAGHGGQCTTGHRVAPSRRHGPGRRGSATDLRAGLHWDQSKRTRW